MRRPPFRRRFCAGAPLIALLALAGGALAQEAGLRGAVDEPLLVQGRIRPDPPELRPKKPPNIARIRAVPPPKLRETLTAPEPVDSGTPLDPSVAPLPPPALDSAPPLQRRRKVEDDPYGPLGYEVGAFLLKPSIEVDFGYSDNPGQQPGKVKGATYVTVTPRIAFESQWSRHDLRGYLEGGYTRYFGVDDDRPKLQGVIDGRTDINRDTAIETEARLILDTERIGADGVSASATKRPLTTSYGATAGIVRQFGDASVRLRGTVDRNQYESDLGGVSRDYSTFGTALRGSYSLSPAVTPFVEVSADRRVYDATVSASGERRDSTGVTGRGGVTLNVAGTLKGEASVGYGQRSYADAGLRDIDGLLVDASLVWTPTALTTVRLDAASTFAESSITGASGATDRTIGVAIAHALRRNLVVTAKLSHTVADYDGIRQIERTTDASLGVEYKLSRSVAVTAAYTYERLASTVPGADYTANTIMAGLKIQH